MKNDDDFWDTPHGAVLFWTIAIVLFVVVQLAAFPF